MNVKLFSRQAAYAVCALAALLPSQMAHAQSIGIAFGNAVLSTDSPGIVAGTNFNDTGLGGSGTNIALHDTANAATTAAVSFTSTAHISGFTGTSTSNAGTNRLYTQGIYGDDSVTEAIVTVTGVPYAAYDVYVFASPDTTTTNTLRTTDGKTTYYYSSGGSTDLAATVLKQTTSTNASSPTVGPGQYQVYHETGSSFTVSTGGSTHDVIANQIFGIQIVSTAAAPEPDAFALLVPVILTAAFGIVRRRTSK